MNKIAPRTLCPRRQPNAATASPSARAWLAVPALLLAAALAHPARAQSALDGGGPIGPTAAAGDAGARGPDLSLHTQLTTVFQYHPAFDSPYVGPDSLQPSNNGKETVDATLFAGLRLWRGAAIYVNPEIDQGFGLSNTLGIAGFPSGEAYKVGARNPYFRLPRAFVRQVIDLGGAGEAQMLPDAANQFADSLPPNNVTITVGKFSVPDIFDMNRYAHDSKNDFLNWAVIESGAFDYPADSWAYTDGAAVEWTQSWWTARGGAFALSKMPNSKDIDTDFTQFGAVAELEERHELLGHAGKLRLLGYLNRGRMGKYADAVALAEATDSVPSTALVRHYASRPGAALNLEQELGQDLGAFARVSYDTGDYEAFEFTEINTSLAFGLSAGGKRWGRADDAVGIAQVLNGLSSEAREYFAAGGAGLLIGDGRLPDYAREKITEAYYALRIVDHLTVSGDVQAVFDPAYNRDRGPVYIFGVRVHAEY